jgi:hypothetical protein
MAGIEEPMRSLAVLQADPGAYRTWRIRRVPDENRVRRDEDLSALRGGQERSAAHAGALPGVGAAPLQLASHHWREVDLLDDHRSNAGRAVEIRCCPPLLRASYARKGPDRKGEKGNLPSSHDNGMDEVDGQATHGRSATTFNRTRLTSG